jgi:hypothetical protein
MRRPPTRSGETLEEELRSYEIFLHVSSVIAAALVGVMAAIGRFPPVAHVFAGVLVGLQLFTRWRRAQPLHLQSNERAVATGLTVASMRMVDAQPTVDDSQVP